MEKNVKKEGFRLYQVYNAGTPALYEQQPNHYVPITIVHYIHSSARPGLEIHGHYEFIYDADENREIHEGRAMMMYRYAEDGEHLNGGAVEVNLVRAKDGGGSEK